MEGPRAPQAQEFARVVSFLNENLRGEQDWSIASEYPLALHPTNLHNMRVITESEAVLSHAVLRPVITKTPVGLFKVGAIGSVVTSNEHRNQGLSHQILNHCLKAAHDQLCEFAILWTDLHDFYRKLGFELAGSELSVRLEQEINVPEAELKILDSAQVSPEALLRVFNQHTVCSARTLDEVAKYLKIPNARVYTAWDQNHRLQAYAVEGKGADLKGYIHEWGGGVSKLLPLFAHIRKAQGQPVTVIAPAHARGLMRAFADLGLHPHHGCLGMIKLLHPTLLFTKIKRHARSLGIEDLVLEAKGGQYFVGAGEQVLQAQSENDLVRFLFGPAKPSELATLEPRTREVLERIFPIPLWVWGWDSI